MSESEIASCSLVNSQVKIRIHKQHRTVAKGALTFHEGPGRRRWPPRSPQTRERTTRQQAQSQCPSSEVKC
jgi:hypothetical protein